MLNISVTDLLLDGNFTAPDAKIFKGWSLTKNAAIITEININGGKTLYAIWEDDNNLDNPTVYALF